MKINNDSPQVKIPPPLIVLIFLFAGIFLNTLIPIKILNSTEKIIGVTIAISGIALVLSCAFLFKKAHTRIEPWETTSAIIQRGPYHFSRNPIYLAFVIFGIGAAIFFNTWWIVLMQIPLMMVITSTVIRKEEKYLEMKFGEEYLRYKSEVRRWL